MTIFLLAVAALCLFGLRLPRPVLTGLQEQYMDMDRTTAIKGVFILLVFLTHAVGYIPAFPGPELLHEPYFYVQRHMGQGVVVLFLFYSGYGVMESVRKKGAAYVRAMPRNRVLRTLLHFDLAVLLFVALDAALGTLDGYTLPQILLSFIGWEAVGNSNWYIFAVLSLYLLTWLAFRLFGDRARYIPALAAVTALTCVYMLAVSPQKDAWWYDTVLVYPLGMWFSFGRAQIERLFRKHPSLWYAAAAVLAAVFVFAHRRRDASFPLYLLQLQLMAPLVVLVTMKLNVCNRVLIFFGKHLFEIYILMRIPMLLLQRAGLTNVYAFTLLSFAATVAIAVGFKKLTGALDKRLFVAKKRA